MSDANQLEEVKLEKESGNFLKVENVGDRFAEVHIFDLD